MVLSLLWVLDISLKFKIENIFIGMEKIVVFLSMETLRFRF